MAKSELHVHRPLFKSRLRASIKHNDTAACKRFRRVLSPKDTVDRAEKLLISF